MTGTADGVRYAHGHLPGGGFEQSVEAVADGAVARMSIAADVYGTVSGIEADRLYLGFADGSFFDNATNTMVWALPDEVRVVAFGQPFGAEGALTQWQGPHGIALSAMSRENAYFFVANTAPYVGRQSLPAGPSVRPSLKTRLRWWGVRTARFMRRWTPHVHFGERECICED